MLGNPPADNSVQQAESLVLGSRETLRSVEQDVLFNGATAYMDVLRDTANLNLRRNNVEVLEEQLRQTRDRFNVGEVTRTDASPRPSRGWPRGARRLARRNRTCGRASPGSGRSSASSRASSRPGARSTGWFR